MFEDKYKEWILKGLEGAVNLLEHMKREDRLNKDVKAELKDILNGYYILDEGSPGFFDMINTMYDFCRSEKNYSEEELKRYKTCLQRLEGYAK